MGDCRTSESADSVVATMGSPTAVSFRIVRLVASRLWSSPVTPTSDGSCCWSPSRISTTRVPKRIPDPALAGKIRRIGSAAPVLRSCRAWALAAPWSASRP